MRKIMGWDNAPAYTDGVEHVPAGGHVCKIIGAKVEMLDNGSEKLVLALEIDEGSPLDGIFQRTFASKHAGNPAAKWPCTFGQFLTDRDGLCNPYFKGLIRCVENSNPGYHWAWEEATLKGKRVGMVFREEEFMGYDGSVKTATRPAFARSVDRIREGVEVPEIKRLSGNPAQASGVDMPDGFTEVQDKELPF